MKGKRERKKEKERERGKENLILPKPGSREMDRLKLT